jgi:hypothetical protein
MLHTQEIINKSNAGIWRGRFENDEAQKNLLKFRINYQLFTLNLTIVKLIIKKAALL